MKRIILLMLLTIFSDCITTSAFAELYEYTDSDGVIHFTDDISKVPKNKRGKSNRSIESTLSPRESKTLEILIKTDKSTSSDMPVKNVRELKKNLNDYADYSKSELGEPGEPKDSRLSTPEGALRLFKSGLRDGNLNDIKASVIGNYWDKMEGFKGLNKTILNQMSELIPNQFVSKIMSEHSAVIDLKEGQIYLINVYGNWKIQDF